MTNRNFTRVLSSNFITIELDLETLCQTALRLSFIYLLPSNHALDKNLTPYFQGLPWRRQWSKNLSANVGDTSDSASIPGSGRSPGEGNGNLLWYSCPKNLMVRGAWRATVHRVTQSGTRLKWLYTHEVLYRYICITNPSHSVPSEGPPAPVLVEPVVWDGSIQKQRKVWFFPPRMEILELPL